VRDQTFILARVEYDLNGGCWLWNSYIGAQGYGRTNLGGRVFLAHRLSWESVNGPIPDGLFICHKCDVRACVNPDHLYAGTIIDNTRDAVQRGRHTRGETHPCAKLSDDQVAQIRAESTKGRSRLDVAREFGVRPQTIGKIVNGIRRAA
jgi:hypothetical protein